MVVRWTFFDPIGPVTYTFPLNPSEGGLQGRKKNVSFEPTVGSGGRNLAFEGAEEPQRFSFSGVILSEAQYDDFNTWYEKRHQIQLSDDLSRQWWVYIDGLETPRRRSVNYAWSHRYTITAVELDWP